MQRTYNHASCKRWPHSEVHWPYNEANRRHMFSYDATVLRQADHFLMMDRPEEFNRALEKAIKMLLRKSVQ